MIPALIAAGILSGCGSGTDRPNLDLINAELYAAYQFGNPDNVIDIGTQPFYTPTGLISGAMARDAVLREELSALGFEVRFHAFAKGHDVNSFLGAGDLEAGIGGDMPALVAAAGAGVRVTSMMQAGFSSIVANRPMLIKELSGGKIGYAYGSNAHFALLRTLSSAGLTDDQVKLIQMDVIDMPAALESEEIIAFSAWEPFAGLSELANDESTVIHRSQNSGYLYFSEVFLERNPEVALQIIAAEIRAAAWIRSDRSNLLRAAEWSIADAAALWAVPAALTAENVADLAEKDLFRFDGPDFVPAQFLESGGRLQLEFEFLQEIGSIPSDAAWSGVLDSFDRALMIEILATPEAFHLNEYVYVAATGSEK